MAEEMRYRFSWDLLGDIGLGRPNMGPQMRLEVYRLMQFCFRDVMERQLGSERTDAIFRDAGRLAGEQFYQNVVGEVSRFEDFIDALQKVFIDMGIGVLRIEEADVAAGRFVLTVSEDLDCSGLPELNYEICTYDEGFIAGLMESFTGRRFVVREVDCWCTGGRTCRFTAEIVS